MKINNHATTYHYEVVNWNSACSTPTLVSWANLLVLQRSQSKNQLLLTTHNHLAYSANLPNALQTRGKCQLHNTHMQTVQVDCKLVALWS